jgi:nondiscriminating glutamyl-tRNA synthetase
VNAHYLHHAGGATLAAWAREFLPPAAAGFDSATLAALLELVRGNIDTLSAIPGELAPFLGEAYEIEAAAAAALQAESARRVCMGVAEAFAALAEWNPESIKSGIQSTGKALGVKGKDLFQPVRAALTGRTHGPELPLVAGALGRERCVTRLRQAGH